MFNFKILITSIIAGLIATLLIVGTPSSASLSSFGLNWLGWSVFSLTLAFGVGRSGK